MSKMAEVAELTERLNTSIRRTVQDTKTTDPEVVMNSLAAAISLIVSYDSMQTFLETLAACADAKEEARQFATAAAH